MENSERLQKLSDKRLLDVVKNYKRYNYDEDLRQNTINILVEDRGFTIDYLNIQGYLNTDGYDEAVKQYNAFCRNYKIGLYLFIFSLGILIIPYLIMMYIAYQNQKKILSGIRYKK